MLVILLLVNAKLALEEAVSVVIRFHEPAEEAACQVGNAEAPLLVRTWPDVPTPDTLCNAPVVVVPPQITAYAVTEESPVPP